MDHAYSDSESSSGHSDDDNGSKSDDGDDSESDERPKPVRKCLVKAVKKRTGRSSKSTKTYSGAPVRRSKGSMKNSPPFRTACRKSDHTEGWSDSVAATRPCPNRCPLMDLFDMYVCRFGVVCKKCKHIIPLPGLCTHMHRCQRRRAGMFHKANYKFVADHIITTHGFTPDTAFDFSIELLEPIEALDPPTLAYACPIEGCPIWHLRITRPQSRSISLTPLAETTKIRWHRKQHGDDLAAHPELQALFARDAKFECRYVYRPYGTNGRAILVFKEDWTPSTSLITPVGPLPNTTIPIHRIELDVSVGAHFLQELWYPQYIQGLDANQRRLRQLVQLPDRVIAQCLKHTPTRHMELGLCDLADVLPSYLRDANVWLDTKRPEVRDAFVSGTKARYKSLDSPYRRYSNTLLQHLTATTRFLHAVRFKNTAGLGNFEIIGTDSQARAAKALYTYLIQSRGSTEANALLVHAHKLLDAIVHSKTVAEGHIGCLTNQVLCLALMRPNNRFGMANVFTGICARNAHGFFDTISHTVRLKLGGHEDYVPIDQEPMCQSDSTAIDMREANYDDDDMDDGWDILGVFTMDGEAGGSVSEVDFGIDEDDDEEEARLRGVDEELEEMEEELTDMEGKGDDCDSRSAGEFFTVIAFLNFTNPKSILLIPNTLKPGTFMDVVRKTKPVAKGLETKPTLLGLVQEYQAKFLTPKPADHLGHSTPYIHLKRAWLAAQPEAVHERADSGYFVHQDG
ncbi:hypothetical protein PILCRDRAFT_12755 [Piloderma croceum F 1598]|uniref:Uncharacterized protein n=1 Tax=Piloderma croceum (strain F 1598) TaxID=765440 RepID=A0A0C3F9W0_PILCF|nr:hypothetical protein PILCRDRAFT_12755 [Piloderma croceum F 1598]